MRKEMIEDIQEVIYFLKKEIEDSSLIEQAAYMSDPFLVFRRIGLYEEAIKALEKVMEDLNDRK